MTVTKEMPGLIPVPPEGEAILTIIRRQCGGKPLFVGGTVRDALLGLGVKDYDIEVWSPEVLDFDAIAETLRKKADGRWKTVLAGEEFPVIKLRTPDGTEYDIAVPRRDSKTGPGHTGFTVVHDPSLTFEEASARRDFTVNAMAYDPAEGKLSDAHGGLEDLESRVLRHTSPAFTEDPLRVLRGMQFAARFGFTMPAETAVLCESILDTFPELAKERVWMEWNKLLTAGEWPSAGLKVLSATSWVTWFPSQTFLAMLGYEESWKNADSAAAMAVTNGLRGEDRAVVVAAALTWEGGRACARHFLEEIDAPHTLKRRVLSITAEDGMLDPHFSEKDLRKLARRLKFTNIAEWSLVRAAVAKNSDELLTAGRLLGAAMRAGVHLAPAAPLLTGDDLIAEGCTPGPEFGAVLAEAVAAQDDGVFSTKEGALGWFREFRKHVDV